MPTYDYECTSCQQSFELFHSIMSRPNAKCPTCGSRAKRQIGSGAGIIFKGSGFYETDYKRKSAPQAKNDKEPGSSAPPKDAKPASEPASKKSEKKKESSS